MARQTASHMTSFKPSYQIQIILFVITVIILIPFTALAADLQVYLNGEEMSGQLLPEEQNNELLVRARPLADYLEIKMKWYAAIKTLQLEKEDTIIKLMANNPYIQVNNNTYKSLNGLQIKDGEGYIPLKDTVEQLGYIYREEEGKVYVSRPETLVRGISWRRKGLQLVVEMDQLAPYRISETGDPRKIILELAGASLADNFTDALSNKNFYLKIDKSADRSRLQLIIISKYPIPFQRDRGIEEEGNNLVINFLPSISSIKWHERRLEIRANGQMEKPELSLLQDPRRLVIDIPGLMLTNYELKLPENDWIKEIRVSQFKYDPVTLRMVVELHPGRFLYLAEGSSTDTLLFKPDQENRVTGLSFEDNELRFITDNEIEPDIFTLEDPARLVINLLNTVRGQSLKDKIEAGTGLIKTVRTARFNEETVRIVADLAELKGYNYQNKKLPNGSFEHIIVLKKEIAGIYLAAAAGKTDITINLNSTVDYQVRQLSAPQRLVVELKGITGALEARELPEPTGVVEKVFFEHPEGDEETLQIFFELADYQSYSQFSESPASSIKLSLKELTVSPREETGELIVIDAGHGGFDPGAVGPTGLTEKEVNLDIALRVAGLLEDAGFEVLLTRDSDRFISLRERVRIANELKAGLFISIHNNAANGKYSEGTETFLAPNKFASSEFLAALLQQELISRLKRFDRGVKSDNFYVIKYTEMPAALVEVAFISNPHEEALLANDFFREKSATAITAGIRAYLEKTEQGVGSDE